MLQSHKPFESGTADWLMESMERLRLAMGEFVWLYNGDVKTEIGDYLHDLADAAISREKEIQAALAANTPRTFLRNVYAEAHKKELWYLIDCLADTLLNAPDAAKQYCRELGRVKRHIFGERLPRSLYNPAAGILFSSDNNHCDSVCAKRKRQTEALRSFFGN